MICRHTEEDGFYRDYFQDRLQKVSTTAVPEAQTYITYMEDEGLKNSSGEFTKKFPPVKICSGDTCIAELYSMVEAATDSEKTGEPSHVLMIADNPNDVYEESYEDVGSYIFVYELGPDNDPFQNKDCYFDVENLTELVFPALGRKMLQTVTFNLSRHGKLH